MSRAWAIALLLVVSLAAPVVAQSADPPPIRRWLDVQQLQISSRYRWVESNTGRITASAIQWQPQFRARVLLDADRRYRVGFSAQTGSHFVSGWNNTGGGLGEFSGDFALKQLFFSAAPAAGLELQAGGLGMLRGENTEITSYDNDAYLVGERLIYTREQGPLAQIAVTAGYIGDYRTPNVFRRLDRLNDWNYGQVLVGVRVGGAAQTTAEYTHEDGRDIFRQGITVEMPAGVPVLRSIGFDAYERVSPASGAGFNLTGELRLLPRLTIEPGLAHIDNDYLAPGYISLNADRYERGTRVYYNASYALTRDLTLSVFHTRAFSTPYPIPNRHRWDIVVAFNPTAGLKRAGIF